MKRTRFWVLVSILIAITLIFVVCQSDGNGNDDGNVDGKPYNISNRST